MRTYVRNSIPVRPGLFTTEIETDYVPIKGVHYKDGRNGVDGKEGRDGSSLELRKSEDLIQWRREGESDWVDLLPIAEIKGEDGIGKDGKDGDSPNEFLGGGRADSTRASTEGGRADTVFMEKYIIGGGGANDGK
jgi:hypothetical protein